MVGRFSLCDHLGHWAFKKKCCDFTICSVSQVFLDFFPKINRRMQWRKFSSAGESLQKNLTYIALSDSTWQTLLPTRCLFFCVFCSVAQLSWYEAKMSNCYNRNENSPFWMLAGTLCFALLLNLYRPLNNFLTSTGECKAFATHCCFYCPPWS